MNHSQARALSRLLNDIDKKFIDEKTLSTLYEKVFMQERHWAAVPAGPASWAKFTGTPSQQYSSDFRTQQFSVYLAHYQDKMNVGQLLGRASKPVTNVLQHWRRINHLSVIVCEEKVQVGEDYKVQIREERAQQVQREIDEVQRKIDEKGFNQRDIDEVSARLPPWADDLDPARDDIRYHYCEELTFLTNGRAMRWGNIGQFLSFGQPKKIYRVHPGTISGNDLSIILGAKDGPLRAFVGKNDSYNFLSTDWKKTVQHLVFGTTNYHPVTRNCSDFAFWFVEAMLQREKKKMEWDKMDIQQQIAQKQKFDQTPYHHIDLLASQLSQVEEGLRKLKRTFVEEFPKEVLWNLWTGFGLDTVFGSATGPNSAMLNDWLVDNRTKFL
jgi:hypothetical protein